MFIHPSSINFHNSNFRTSNFILFGSKQMTIYHDNSKITLRETSEVTSYSLLFFGGKLESQYLEGTVTVDGWIKFTAPGRIVAIIQTARDAFDRVLQGKISDPMMDVSSSDVIEGICELLATDGLS